MILILIFINLIWVVSQDWFEQYRERVLEAEQLILTTLNFELNVQHPYVPLTSVLNKLGLSKTVLVNLALNLVSEGWVFLFVNLVLYGFSSNVCLYNYTIHFEDKTSWLKSNLYAMFWAVGWCPLQVFHLLVLTNRVTEIKKRSVGNRAWGIGC